MPGSEGVRRRTVMAAGAAGGLLVGTRPGRALAKGTARETTARTVLQPQFVEVALTINGAHLARRLDTRTTLLDALREQFGLTGSKKGCDHGQCGACTVLVNGRRVNSCMTLAVMHAGEEVVTIEGLGTPEAPHALQAAFLHHDGFQCGYCTSGQICSAAGMLREHAEGWPSHVTQDLRAEKVALSDAEIRERMSGNICRCAAYPNIVAAIREAGGAA